MFGLDCMAKSPEDPMGNCKVAWDSFVNNFMPHTASSLLTSKSKFSTTGSWTQLRKMFMNRYKMCNDYGFKQLNSGQKVILQMWVL